MNEDIQQLLELAEKRAKRYKSAKIAAEQLLEQKSRDLFKANQKLENIQDALKDDVAQATYELSVSNRRLQKMLDEKSYFIGQMSHEVRTPLNAIIGLSEILQRTELDEEQLDYVNTIYDGANSLITLLNDMLEITKIEAGRVELNPEKVDIGLLLKNTVSMFEQVAKKKDLSLSLKVYSNVPKTISIDIGRYKQIINNLINNAVKNTEQGGIVIELSYSPNTVSEGIGTLLTRVIDSGIGIEKDKQQRIFNAYEQIGQSTEGVGLGLSICQQLSELMMGKISCKSKVGQGSTFESRLPATLIEQDFDSEADSTDKPLAKLPNLKILVAEDNPTNQKVVAAQLAQLGQQTDMANNGQEAIAKLKAESYDVLICDILMPVMDGEETIKTIRDSDSKLAAQYCIALTASNYQDQKRRLLELGFDAFLSKPASLQQLADALQQVPQELRLEAAIVNPFAKDTESINSASNAQLDTVFDYSFLKTQFGDAYKDIFDQIAPSFLEHAYAELLQLEEHSQAGNKDKVKKLSHSMKGAANSVGLGELAEMLRNIEESPDAINVLEEVSQVRTRMEQLKPLIEREIGREGAGA